MNPLLNDTAGAEVSSQIEGPLFLEKRFWSYVGPGVLVAVGYMDPGNWATDIEAGSKFGYALLSVVVVASLMAILLQLLCVRLGVATGRDLAELCREQYPRWLSRSLWLLAEMAIVACDIAEVLGTALAFHLLLGISISNGVLLTALDTVIILALQGRGYRRIESVVMAFVLIVVLCFVVQMSLSFPNWSQVLSGVFHSTGVWKSSESWYIAVGILGATVMPHNLYLHTSMVQTRVEKHAAFSRRWHPLKMLSRETILSLGVALFINAALLIVAATVLHLRGYTQISGIEEAYQMLTPLVGGPAASLLFAIALFAAGQSSSLTGTIAGQVIMEGFLQWKIPAWQRRLVARSLAIVPAWLGVNYFGNSSLGPLLVGTQVVLSLQLPFAVIPLLLFVGQKKLMGPLLPSRSLQLSGWLCCLLILLANGFMIYNLSE